MDEQIGTTQHLMENHSKIMEWLESISLSKYRINHDDTVDIFQDVTITDDHLPFKLNIVRGNFYCTTVGLKSLLNSPAIVSGNFVCHTNNLTTLMHMPKMIGGDCSFRKNEIEGLMGVDTTILGNLNLDGNPIVSLQCDGRIHIGGNLRIVGNSIRSIDDMNTNMMILGNIIHDCDINKFIGIDMIAGGFIDELKLRYINKTHRNE